MMTWLPECTMSKAKLHGQIPAPDAVLTVLGEAPGARIVDHDCRKPAGSRGSYEYGLDYGLAAGIWTENFGRAHRLARAVEAGRVWINCYNLFPSGAAFGGTKGSGFGREDAFETMLAFTQVKNVVADIAAEQRRFYE